MRQDRLEQRRARLARPRQQRPDRRHQRQVRSGGERLTERMRRRDRLATQDPTDVRIDPLEHRHDLAVWLGVAVDDRRHELAEA